MGRYSYKLQQFSLDTGKYTHISNVVSHIAIVTKNYNKQQQEELQQASKKEGSICLGYKLTTDDTISVTGKPFYQFYESYKVESREYADEKGDSVSTE